MGDTDRKGSRREGKERKDVYWELCSSRDGREGAGAGVGY